MLKTHLSTLVFTLTVVIEAINIRLILPHLLRKDLKVSSSIMALLYKTLSQVSVSFASFCAISSLCTKSALLSEKIFPMGYLFLSRRGRDTIRGKRAPFSPYGEPCARHDSTRLCVQAPTPRLVCRSMFVLLASKTNHAFHVPCARKQIKRVDGVCVVSALTEQHYITRKCFRIA